MFWFYVLPLGFLLTQYTITGFDACAHISEETHGAAEQRGARASGARSSTPRSIGWILLLAITFAAQTPEVAVNEGGGSSPPSSEARRQRLGEVRADHLVDRPAVLRHGVPDQRLAHVLRVQPRRRDPGLADLEPGQRSSRIPFNAVIFMAVLRAASSRSRRSSRATRAASPVAFYAVVSIARDRPLRRLRDPDLPALAQWATSSSPGPWNTGQQVQVDEPVRDGRGSGSSRSIFILPFTPGRRAVARRVRLEVRQLRAARDGRR